MNRPLAIDICCGLGGWSSALVAEGYDVVGFDIERHCYGDERYPAHLVLQDVLTLHGSQFREAALIVASPPCQFFSYTAMPWTKAKALAAAVRADPIRLEKELALFNACFRIQREASEAAGRHIPMVVENVRGAEPWVGRARWAWGSFHLWGDVPALMPPLSKRPSKNGGGSWFNIAHNTTSGVGNNPDGRKVPGFRFDGSGRSFQSESVRRTNVGNGARFTSRDCGIEAAEGRKGAGAGAEWFDGNLCAMPSSSPRRKAASARIAKIPLTLATYIARTYRPAFREAAE